MALSKAQQKKLLAILLAILAVSNLYLFLSADAPKTAPLMYARGAVAQSPVRQGLLVRPAGADALTVLTERREEKYPGVSRDIFRMSLPAPHVKPVATVPPVVVAVPTPTAPVIPQKTPEEIAAEAAKADLAKFRFLGYLTDKDNTLFLSKEGELFMVKSGERVQGTYRIKESSKEHVVLLDTATRVEVRIELSGSDTPPQQQQPPQRMR